MLAIVVVLAWGTVLAGTVTHAQETNVVVEASRQTTTNPMPARSHAVPVVAVHPDDPQTIVVGEGESFTGSCALHVSRDNGLSWTSVPIEQSPEYPKCVFSNFGPILDVAFASDGTLYVAYSGFDPGTYHQRIFLARTTDLGGDFQTTEVPWVEPDLANGQFGGDALPSVVVDPHDPQKVYVGWMTNNGTWNLSSETLEGKRYYYDVFSRPYVAASSDGGRTFSEAVDVAGDVASSDSRGWMNEPHLVAGTDGAVYAFFGENMRPLPEGSEEMAPPAHLYMSKSTDGGRTWEPKAIHTREAKSRDWIGQPSPGVDLNTGDLYVVWDEQTEEDATPYVAFMASRDGGQTWSEPLRLNDVEPARTWNFCEFCPSVDVAPNGRVDVVWYDWRTDAAFDEEAGTNRYQDIFYAYSTDGGRTWSENVRVSDRSIDRNVGVWNSYGVHGNVGLASADSAALVAWDDTRNATEENQTQDVYFTRVRHESEAPATGVSTESKVLWSVIGAGIALALGGLILLVGTRASRRSPAGGTAAEPASR